MKITVTFYADLGLRAASLRVEPSWLARWLLLREERADTVVAVPSINGGTLWVSDETGRRITDARILDEIDRQHARATVMARQGVMR